MKTNILAALSLGLVAGFAFNASAQDRRPVAAEAEELREESDGSGEGEEVQERAVGPIGTSTVGTEVRQSDGPRSVSEGHGGGDSDDDGSNDGTGGN